MASNIVVPQLGESVVEARVARWLKQRGRQPSPPASRSSSSRPTRSISRSAPIRPACWRGSSARTGEDVKVGEVLGGGRGSPAAQRPRRRGSAAPRRRLRQRRPHPPHQRRRLRPDAATAADRADDVRRRRPTAREMAEEHGVDLGQRRRHRRRRTRHQGGRRSGTVSAAHRPPAPPPAPATCCRASASRRLRPPRTRRRSLAAPPVRRPRAASWRRATEERVRMSKRRADHRASDLVEAQHTAAMLTTFNEVDMTAVHGAARAPEGSLPEAHGVGLGLVVVLRQGGVGALKRVPAAQRRDPGRRDGAEALLRHRHRRRRAAQGLVVPGAARRRPDVVLPRSRARSATSRSARKTAR